MMTEIQNKQYEQFLEPNELALFRQINTNISKLRLTELSGNESS
jgi:hypothetical protein